MGSVIIFFFYSLPVLLSSSVCVYIGTSPLSTIRRRHTQNTVVVSRTDVKNNKTKRRKKRFFKTDCGSVRGRCWHPAMGTKKTNTKQPATNCRQTDQPTDRPAVRPQQKVLERDVIIGPLISPDDRKPFKSLEHERRSCVFDKWPIGSPPPTTTTTADDDDTH